MASLSLVELRKRNNLDIFLNKWKNNEMFTFIDKQQRRLPPYHEPTAEILRMAVAGNAKAARLIQRDKALKTILPLSSIQKTGEFGSRGGAGGGPHSADHDLPARDRFPRQEALPAAPSTRQRAR